MRSKLMLLAGLSLVVSTYWNLWSFTTGVSRLPPRAADNMVVWESRFLPIHYALLKEKYFRGDIAYATVRSLRGEKRTENDDIHWVELRYVTIPLVLVRDVPTPYVLGDFTGDHKPPTPEGLTEVLDPGQGLVLYKRTSAP